jgi:hypothetical protein
LWQVSGILTRQNANYFSNPIIEKKKKDEKKIIEILIKELESDKEFIKLDKQKIKKLKTYGLPRLESWTDLMKKSNFKESLIGLYSLLSSYAHTEYLSILQLKQSSYNISDPNNIIRMRLSLNLIRIINAMIADWLKNKYKSVELIYNTMPNDFKKFVEIWSDVAKKPAPNTGYKT